MADRKMVIIGLDGATFTLIKPWVKQGKLPHLAQLMSDGCHMELESTIHPISAHAWTTFMTGKNAGKHGIFDFIERLPGTYDLQYSTSNSRGAETLWKILSHHGKKIGIFNVPLTYPPEPVKGFMLTGWGTPGKNSNFTYPSSLKKKVLEKFGEYKLVDVDKSLGDPQEYISYQNDTVTQIVNITRFLLDEYDLDLFMVVFMAIDQMQHIFWHCMDPTHPHYNDEENEKYGGVLLDIYQRIDNAIGELQRCISPNSDLVILSDHGCGPTQKVIYLHKWLEEKGLLNFRNHMVGKNYFQSVIGNFRLKIRKYMPRIWKNEIIRRFSFLVNRVDSYLTTSNIDWSRTKAFPWGVYSNIIINLKGREPEGIVEPGKEYEEVCQFIEAELYEMKDPDTGKTVVEKVYRKEELYHGDYLQRAPDLIVVFKNYSYRAIPAKNITPNRQVFEKSCSEQIRKSMRTLSDHRLEGIGIVKGQGIVAGQEIKNAKIVDLAPTILYMMGLPVPSDMDGQVLKTIFERQKLETHPIQYVDVDGKRESIIDSSYKEDEREIIENQLRGLGYLE